MQTRVRVFAWAVLGLTTPSVASAATEASANAGGGLPALTVQVDLAGARVRYQSCSQLPCPVVETSPSVALPVDRGRLPTPGEVGVRVVDLAGGRHVVHVRVPILGGEGPGAPAWEGVFAAGAEPLFAAITGWTHGEPGERTGVALQWIGDGAERSVVSGDIREDLRVCGDDATLLQPRGLDAATLAWHGATLQRLPRARREGAQRVVASARGGTPADTPLAPLLTAEGASTAIGAPKALSDGDAETTWGESRPGAGQGEFVLLRAPHEVPIARFAVAVAPRAPRPDGAAPRTFYLATDAALFEVTLPEDAWQHPGAAYDIPLPEAVTTSCVALVLGEAYARGNPRPNVTVAELLAYSAFDGPGATPEAVARALSGGGPRAEAAAGILKRAGARGLDAATATFSSLDPAGRALAVDVAAASSSCAASSRLLAPALSDTDEVVREKARAKLEQPHCGRDAVPALVDALSQDATRARAAKLLASVAPSQALAPLGRALGLGSPRDRATVRSAFAHAAASAGAGEIGALLGEARDPAARVELLRASAARLADARDAADAALEEVFASSPPLRTRYVLMGSIAELARAGDAREEARLIELLTRDPEPMIRVRAAELAGASARASAALELAARDPEPRVRESAFRTATTARVGPAQAAAIRALATDAWTFVRSEAAAALAALPANVEADAALGEALADKASRVRAAAVAALAGHAARPFVGRVRDRFRDAHEDPDVRVAAAHALGALCDTSATGELAVHAATGASSPDPDEVALGLAATEALGQIHPVDLAKRLAGVRVKGARPDAQRAADAALSARGTCR